MAEKPAKIHNRVQIILLMFCRLIFAFKTNRNGSEIYLLYAREIHQLQRIFKSIFNSVISDHTTSRNREIVSKVVIVILLKTTGLKS